MTLHNSNMSWMVRTVVLATLGVWACSDDDNTIPPPVIDPPNIRLVSVDPATDTFSFMNFGAEMIDISDFQLCSQLQYTQNLSALTVESGNLQLAPGAEVTLSGWPVDDQAADLGLYLPTTNFSNPDRMLDFIQWGSSGNGREAVADQKGIWNAGDFIDGPAPFTYIGNGQQNGIDQWEVAPAPPAAGPNVRMLTVDPLQDVFLIHNFGDQAIDISDYRLCSRFNYTANLSSLNVDEGSLVLQPGESVSISGWPVEDASADLGLYIPSGGFENPDSMVDFMQWGAAGIGREPVADQKGIWSAGTFLTGDGPFNYQGDGGENGIGFWE